jgi:pheromone alpha factor receptor
MAETLAPQYIVNASFDPWAQEITVLAPDGRTPLTFQYSAIMLVQNTAVYQSISTGLQVGASLILLLILLLITNKEKRRSVVYLLNSLALLIIVIRGIIMFVAITGPFFDFYRWISKYYTGLRDAKDLSISGEILTFMLVTTIEISLALQVRIVCCNLASLQQLAVNIINSLVVIVVCGIRFALMVVDIFWSIDGIEQETIAQFELTSRLASAANITLVISIGISTAIFCAKLAFAIESRRSMGMTQFGPMQIIFIMGCQTMVTPRE